MGPPDKPTPALEVASPVNCIEIQATPHTELETIMDDVTLVGIDLGKHSFVRPASRLSFCLTGECVA
jgi:hypothetical protein